MARRSHQVFASLRFGDAGACASRRDVLVVTSLLAGAPLGFTPPVLADAGPVKKGPEALLISGMPPPHDDANGAWSLVPDLYINDRAIYTHNTEELYLTMSDCGYFQISESATGACTGFAKDSGKGVWLVDDVETLVKVRVKKKSETKIKNGAKTDPPVDAKKDLQPKPPPTPTETEQSTAPTKLAEAAKPDAAAESGVASQAKDSVKSAAPVDLGDGKVQAPTKLAEAVKPDAAAESGVAKKTSDAVKPAASANPGGGEAQVPSKPSQMVQRQRERKEEPEAKKDEQTTTKRLIEMSADDLAAADRLLKRMG